jgi:mannose-6-phosphate isomerase-like protein (cupin superfamily)
MGERCRNRLEAGLHQRCHNRRTRRAEGDGIQHATDLRRADPQYGTTPSSVRSGFVSPCGTGTFMLRKVVMTARDAKSPTAIVGSADDLDWFDTLPGEQMALRVNSCDVGGAFTVIEAHVPPFVGPPLHYHKEREEIFEVLEGRFRFHCGGEEFEASPRTSVVIPSNSVHGWVGLGPRPARLLFTFVPGGTNEFFPLIGQNVTRRLARTGPATRHLVRRKSHGCPLNQLQVFQKRTRFDGSRLKEGGQVLAD